MNKRHLIALMKLGRFFILIAGLIAYTLGLSMAYHDLRSLDLPKTIIGLTILISATLAAHYANEYADADTDSLTRRTWFSGGSGVLPSKIIPRSWALNSAISLALICTIITSTSFYFGYLSLLGVFITAIGLTGGWFYSMPPLRLERTSWGIIDNTVLGGFLMPLIAYILQTGSFGIREVIILIPIALGVFVNLLGVHWADRKADAAVGKNTLVVNLDKNVKRVQFISIVFIYLFSTILIFFVPWEVVIAIFLTIPLALWTIIDFKRSPMSGSFFMCAIMIFASAGFIIS